MYKDILFEKDVGFDQFGDLSVVDEDAAIKQSIIIRLKTPKGSNAFHPEYGNAIFDILSDNIDEDWISKAISYIEECVEQDSNIKAVSIDPGIIMESRFVNFHIEYQVKDSGKTSLLTWGDQIG